MDALELNLENFDYMDATQEVLPQQDAWIIDTDAKAEWALRKIAYAEEETKRITKACDEMISHYTALREEQRGQCTRSTDNLRNQLWQYFQTVPHRHTDTQEIYKLPTGSLRLKQRNPDIQREDDVLMVNYPEFVQTTQKLQWGELKKARLKIAGDKALDVTTGEIVEGITVVPLDPEFIVKFDG